jgi:hypothetical protein
MPAEEFHKLRIEHYNPEFHNLVKTVNLLIDELSVIEANQQHVLNFIRENLPEARKSNLT